MEELTDELLFNWCSEVMDKVETITPSKLTQIGAAEAIIYNLEVYIELRKVQWVQEMEDAKRNRNCTQDASDI